MQLARAQARFDVAERARLVIFPNPDPEPPTRKRKAPVVNLEAVANTELHAKLVQHVAVCSKYGKGTKYELQWRKTADKARKAVAAVRH